MTYAEKKARIGKLMGMRSDIQRLINSMKRDSRETKVASARLSEARVWVGLEIERLKQYDTDKA